MSIIYEDLLKRTSYRTFLKGIAFAFVVLLVSQLLQNLLVWFVSLDKIEWMKSLSKWYAIRGVFSEQLFISLVGAILTLVVYINKEFWKIHKDCKELETILSVFNRSLPHSKSLLSEMRYRAFLVAHGGEDAAKITNRIDPKLFSSLDYGNKIVTKTPPPIRLDEQYIDDIFNKNVNTIYTLWTEEPSTWLDPMMQFYLANLGIRNLTELVNRLGNGLDIYNRDSVEYRSFESYKQSMLATKGFKMARIVLLKEEWFKLYEDELAILLAISEIFHLPFFLLKRKH